MATAPVDIPVNIKGLSDLQKLERRMEALEREVTRLQGKLPKTNRELEKTGRSAKRAAGGIRTVGAAVKSLLLPLATATAAIGGLAAGFRTIAGQDFALAKVRSLGVDSKALAVSLKAVSKELDGNASVAELTAAAYDVASAGFTDAADAAMVLKAASLGAVGGFSDINTVGDAATSVLNAYGKSARDAGKLVDGFIQTQNDGKIVVDEYARNIGKVASAAAGLKIPIEEVNTVIAQSTASGVQAEVAFTGLKGALARLASGEASKALKEFGINIDSASLEADGLLGTLEKFKQLDTGTILKALGTEAGPALLPVINNLEKAQELLENQKNAAGAASRAQKEAANTINGAWNRVRVAFENLFSDQAALAQAIIPILDGVASAVDGITFALEQWRNIAREVNSAMKEITTTAGLVGDAFGALGDAIKWAADNLSKLLLRADGMEQFQGLGRDRFKPGQMASFGADYKAQEAALFKAASGGSSGGSTPTPVPGFSPSGSSGGGGSATDTLQQQLKAGQELARQFERRKALLLAENELQKSLLENDYMRLDLEKQIKETAAASQQAGLLAQAQELAQLERKKAIAAFGQDALDQAQSLIDSTYQQIEADARRQELIAEGINPALADSLVAIEKQFEPVKKILDEKILTLETTIEQFKAEGKVTEELEKQLELIKKRRQEVEGAEGDAKDNAKKEDPGKIEQYIKQLETELTDFEGMVVSLAQTIESELSSAMSNAITGIIDGTMTAEEAFATMFKNIGKAFIDMATEMIAKALVMKALGILGGGGGGGGGGGFGVTPLTSGMSFFADGGMPSLGETSVVGERGPELFKPTTAGTVISNEQSRAQLNMYSPGNATEAPQGPMNVNMNYSGPTMAFDDKRYLPIDAVPGIIKDAAKQGEQRALSSMRNRVSTRNRVGI